MGADGQAAAAVASLRVTRTNGASGDDGELPAERRTIVVKLERAGRVRQAIGGYGRVEEDRLANGNGSVAFGNIDGGETLSNGQVGDC